mmetsp:Transcript_31965/g.59500  ORF Transcript_31965/g.59500 Transcript_31965/m.59500 type:complete len:142 (+) Transcript_31965:461-886(+)
MNRMSFSIVPLREDSHCLVMVADSRQRIKSYDDFFALIRLRNGKFEVRDGTKYAYDEKLEYTKGRTYDVEVYISHDRNDYKGDYDVEVFTQLGAFESFSVAKHYNFRNTARLASDSGKICFRSPGKWADCAVANLQVYGLN